MGRSIELETALAELLKALEDFFSGKDLQYPVTLGSIKELHERYKRELIVYSSQLEQTYYRRKV